MQNHINFRTEDYVLKDLVYNDCVYAWVLLHSYYNPTEKHNYIYKEDINYTKIANQIHRSRQTVSKRFNDLLDSGIIKAYKYEGKKAFKIPYYNEFEEMHGETVFQLLCLPFKTQKEELIKTYAYLLKKKRIAIKEKRQYFTCSSKEILTAFGHSEGNGTAYDRIRGILTILQGAGILKFRTTLPEQKPDGTWRPAQMEVYEVNNKASDEWLGLTNDDKINKKE